MESRVPRHAPGAPVFCRHPPHPLTPRLHRPFQALRRGLAAACLCLLAAGAIAPLAPVQAADEDLRRALQSEALVEDPFILWYLQRLGDLLLTQAPGFGGQVRFLLINGDGFNAFASPEGYVGVFAGAMQALETEGELAGLLAHEIAHLVLYHGEDRTRSQSAAAATGWIALGALLAGIVSGNVDTIELASSALLLNQGVASAGIVNLIRTNEREADRVGMQLLIEAGYDPEGMVRLMRTLLEQGPSSVHFPYLRTHPLSSERVSDIENRARLQPRDTAKGISDTPDFQLMRARLKVLRSPASSLLKETRQRLAADPRELSALYTLALLASRSRGLDKKSTTAGLEPDNLKLASRLLAASQNNPIADAAAARLHVRDGRPSRGLALYSEALRSYPAQIPLLLQYIEDLEHLGALGSALAELKKAIAYSREPELFFQLARLQRKNGNLAASHEALADYYLELNLVAEASRQLQLGIDETRAGDPNRQRLERRLGELRRQFRLWQRSQEH